MSNDKNMMLPQRRNPRSGGPRRSVLLAATIVALLIDAALGWALGPEHLVLVVNTAEPRSMELARYYGEKRGVPPENLIRLSTTTKEHISREDYERRIAAPVRAFFDKHDPEGKKFGCLVLFYGIPLRVDPPRLTADEREQLAALEKRSAELKEKITMSKEEGDTKAAAALQEEEAGLKKSMVRLKKTLEGASVDSELALVRETSYKLEGWVPNALFAGFRRQVPANALNKIVLVSRLDGPSEATVRRIIDDSLQAEQEGLAGAAYFDARWPEPAAKELTPYQLYDKAIHHAARLLGQTQRLNVVLDEKETLFQPGEAPGAALYCGWYSLARYVDAFTWARGAVGYHIASAECTTLKNARSTAWCKTMLDKGAAATIGPVAEPYVNAFPLPDIFFSCLVDGRPTLAECYALALPSWSWQMVLIGDPLYRPFKQQRGSAKQE